MMKHLPRYMLAATFLCALAGQALAHSAAGHMNSIALGLAHPVSGLDHMLAMVLVGVIAWKAGGHGRWALPLTFVAAMIAAGAAAIAGVAIPAVEAAIALSVVVLGVIVLMGVQPSLGLGVGLVAAAAIFHGYAHGAEVPGDAGGMAYAAGFALATALLHGAGMVVAFLASRDKAPLGGRTLRTLGGVSALVGAGILINAF